MRPIFWQITGITILFFIIMLSWRYYQINNLRKKLEDKENK